MKTKRILCLLVSLFLLLTVFGILPIAGDTDAEENYIRDGLVSWFKGDENTRGGQDTDSAVWEDLVSGNDLTIDKNACNYFTEEGLQVQDSKHYFNNELLELVNNSYFTIEIEFGDFDPTGSDYNVFMNSTNDYFSLFRRVSQDVIEWKFGGGSTRPKILQSMLYLGNHLLTFTCEYGDSIVMYVDGMELARAHCDLYMGADDLFIGQYDAGRSYSALYKNIRFYSRPLTSEEVKHNATVAGYEELVVAPSFVSVAQPVTNIVGDVAMVRPINSQNELTDMMNSDVLPATAVYVINEKLEILDTDRKPISTVGEILKETKYQIIPCFRIQDKAMADALADYLHDIYFYDVQLMCSNKTLLKYVREQLPECVGILDLRATYADVADLSTEQLLDIRRAVKTYNASVAILPVGLCRNEDVQYLYERQVNIWAWGTNEPDTTEIYYALLSGAVGVVTDKTAPYLDVACNKLAQNTLTRVPTNIGHRGVPSLAPECTLEGSILAHELGANVIEMDVDLTRDGHVIAMHDSTTGRTCNENLVISESTLAELKELYAYGSFADDPVYNQCRIPTLDEYLEWFKGKDCLLFIEIKSGNPAIVPAIKKLIDKYNMYDQCSVITFSTTIMAAMRKDYPEMSVGYLSGTLMSGADSDANVRQVMSFIGRYNGTHNPEYNGYTASNLRACLIRGISIYPWTIAGNVRTMSDYFLWGYSGLTNDHAYLLEAVTNHVRLVSPPTFDEGTSAILGHSITAYNQSTSFCKNIQIEVLEGEASVVGNHITPENEQPLTFITSSEHRIGDEDRVFTMYTQPLTVNQPVEAETKPETEPETEPITAPAETETIPTDEDETETADTSSTEKGTTDTTPIDAKEGCHSTVNGYALLILSLGAAVVCAPATKRKGTGS